VARRARHDLPAVQDRRADVVRLRAEGKTWDEIAGEVGYSNASAASKAWHAAIQQRPDLTVDAIRRAERERLEAMDAVLSGIVSAAPIKTTSIGRTQWDPRTCTCGVGGATNREHDVDCEVQPVLDMSVVIQAIKERRMVGESLRRLTGADQPPPAARDPLMERLEAEIKAEQERRLATGGAAAELPKPSDVPWRPVQVDGVWTITSTEATG
jgi:hypothetical protein